MSTSSDGVRKMTKESIVDASIPSAGRIYDYFLGGHHNFEVDRRAAEEILIRLPFLSKLSRLQRWCLQDIGQELTAVRGFDTIIDFASGLPTQDHLHTVVPSGTTVIYSDYDPVVVEYAREILGDTPGTYFFEADARRPEELLNNPEITDILNGKRDVAIVYWGVGGFLTDEEISYAADVFFDWAGPTSTWAFNAQGAEGKSDQVRADEVLQIYRQMGTPFYLRSLSRYKELVQPWRPDDQGFVNFLDWHSFDESVIGDEDVGVFGEAGTGFGAYLIK
ncbi:MAG: SAM-dependent methyltransferase [Chloroflexota bacterium]|nr:SAM-dependent methyltransferase [Chloroflexota bacterium]